MIRLPENLSMLARSSLALAALLSSIPAVGHSVQSSLEMTVISNEAFGAAVLEGQLDTTIRRIEALDTRWANEFSINNNLCVAYTKNGELKQARKACDAAITEVRADVRGRSAFRFQVDRRHAAIALSNRGVLHAVTGDRDSAMKDFRKAVKLRARLAAPRKNLEFLENNETVAVSLTDR